MSATKGVLHPQPARRACPLCSSARERFPTWSDAPRGSGSHGYVTCPDCRLVFCDLWKDPVELEQLHRRQYAGELTPERLHRLDPERSRRRLFSAAFQRSSRRLLEELRAHVSSPEPRLLEVGCASGGFLRAAEDAGMRATGVEVSADAARHGREGEGLDIRIGVLEEQRFGENSFDIVVLYDLIEHVFDPVQLLRECARVLEGSGVLAIHTLNLDCWTARRAGSGFYMADTGGGHVCLFTTATLERCLAAAGFRVLSATTSGFRWVQQDRSRSKQALGWRRPFVRVFENLVHEATKPFGKGHFQMVVARREPS